MHPEEDEKRTEVRGQNTPKQKRKTVKMAQVCNTGFGGFIAVVVKNVDTIYEPEVVFLPWQGFWLWW
jgi:hypothetical protein